MLGSPVLDSSHEFCVRPYGTESSGVLWWHQHTLCTKLRQFSCSQASTTSSAWALLTQHPPKAMLPLAVPSDTLHHPSSNFYIPDQQHRYKTEEPGLAWHISQVTATLGKPLSLSRPTSICWPKQIHSPHPRATAARPFSQLDGIFLMNLWVRGEHSQPIQVEKRGCSL